MFDNRNIKLHNNFMGITYKPLWMKLVELEINKTQMREKAGISTRQLAAMNKNEAVHIRVIEKICSAYDLKVEEVVQIVND